MWDRVPWHGRWLLSDPAGLPGHLRCAGSRGGSQLAQLATRNTPFSPVPGTASRTGIADGRALFPGAPGTRSPFAHGAERLGGGDEEAEPSQPCSAASSR